jgi:hypothetical protein
MTPAMSRGAKDFNMPDLEIKLLTDELPAPGEVAEIEQDGYLILVENTNPPELESATPSVQVGDLIKYVPVDVKARNSVVRHAAAVYQCNTKTRVDSYTLCDRSGTRRVQRRRDREPLTNVTCTQCRKYLAAEGLMTE